MDPKRMNIILAVAVVVLLGVVAYFAFGQKSEVALEPTPNVDVQANTNINTNTVNSNTQVTNQNLKTYSNTAYGFEFQYPKEWEVYARNYGPTGSGEKGFIVNVGPPENIKYHINPPEGSEGAPPYFMVTVTTPVTMDDCKDLKTDGLKATPITISGIKTNKCVSLGMFGKWMEILFAKNKQIYHLTSALYDDNEWHQVANVDKIVASFKLK